MNRRNFIKNVAAISVAGTIVNQLNTDERLSADTNANLARAGDASEITPRAITMWDFSWLERRWPGAGYEDWDKVLDELVERGYDAVRIDAYPHLLAENPNKEWTLLPVWDQQVWGSPAVNKVTIHPALNCFIAKCKDRKIKVGLSSWYREDVDKTLMNITSPEIMAQNWIKTLDIIAKDNLLDTILYVDLCNEWPGDIWAPYFKNDPPEFTWTYWHTEKSMKYMRDSINQVKQSYPNLSYCYSFTGGNPELYVEKDLSFFDLLEHHIWMSQLNNDEYYKQVGYKYDRFSPESYKNLVENSEKVYYEKPDYWKKILTDGIQLVAESAKKAELPLITTECWGLVDFKDWPLLKWDIVKELCELGTLTAAATGQWIAIATSNFCGPQFIGMWRDVEWHQRLTQKIKSSVIHEELLTQKIKNALL